jgi:hypothetical protein
MSPHDDQHGTGRDTLERDESYRRRWWTLTIL